jgi:hypothetical protein
MTKFNGLIIVCPSCEQLSIVDVNLEPDTCPLCEYQGIHGGHCTVEAVDLRSLSLIRAARRGAPRSPNEARVTVFVEVRGCEKVETGVLHEFSSYPKHDRLAVLREAVKTSGNNVILDVLRFIDLFEGNYDERTHPGFDGEVRDV